MIFTLLKGLWLVSVVETYEKFGADDIRGKCMDSYAVLLMRKYMFISADLDTLWVY